MPRDTERTPAERSDEPRGQHRDELLRLVKGSPQPEVSLETAARRIGISTEEVEELVAELEREGALRREGERLVVAEAGSQAQRPRS